jgi:hypothetical protein
MKAVIGGGNFFQSVNRITFVTCDWHRPALCSERPDWNVAPPVSKLLRLGLALIGGCLSDDRADRIRDLRF